jgi:hypothetical protein
MIRGIPLRHSHVTFQGGFRMLVIVDNSDSTKLSNMELAIIVCTVLISLLIILTPFR